MSERNGGGNIPGATRRIPGIPSDAQFFDLSGFTTLNAQRPRAAIGDQEMAWSQNMMPIGPNYLRSLPDANPIATYTAAASPYAPPAVKYQSGISVIGAVAYQNGDMAGPYTFPPLTITTPDTLILLYIAALQINTNPAPLDPVIASITDTSALTFNARTTQGIPFSQCGLYTGCFSRAWSYWASSPGPLVGETVSVTFTEPVRISVAGLVALSGASVVNPWDPNGSLPAHNFGTVVAEPLTVPGVSTTNGGALLVAFGVDGDNYANTFPSLQVTPGWTRQVSPWTGNIFTGSTLGCSVLTQPTLTPVSGITVEPMLSSYTSKSWIMLADAIG
jgi:hypothetical protein